MKMNNSELRNLEIKFFLICYDLTKLTMPPSQDNIHNFIQFLKQIDLTNTIDFEIIKNLANAIMLENNNIRPNRIELFNYAYSQKKSPNILRKYIKFAPETYKAFVSQIKHEAIYIPTHLQPPVYAELKRFLKLVEKIKDLGV